jgi:hypothetical protein
MWDLWWTKWHWDRFFPEFFGFPLSVSFHRCSIVRKRTKIIIIIFIGSHNKPHGCGASVASAAGPFTTTKNLILRYKSVLPQRGNQSQPTFVFVLLLFNYRGSGFMRPSSGPTYTRTSKPYTVEGGGLLLYKHT